MAKSFNEYILRIKYQNILDQNNVNIVIDLICNKSKTKVLLNIKNENEEVQKIAREILNG